MRKLPTLACARLRTIACLKPLIMLGSVKRPTIVAGIITLSFTFWIILSLTNTSASFLQNFQTHRPETHNVDVQSSYTVIRSVSTQNGQYFPIDFRGESAMNPNLIPHPSFHGVWILVAQLHQESEHFVELVCNAKFEDDVMKCIGNPSKLPIDPTFGDKCTGDLDYINLNQGPHDARVFYGPKQPYTVFGSNSQHTCFGQWAQDFRSLVEWGYSVGISSDEFIAATELQRPLPWNAIEKNWFLFWDLDGRMYAHYDLFPKRVFAELSENGVAGPDLGLATSSHDGICMESYVPEVGPKLESIHQATNSLSITMCRRRDLGCTPDDSNTFIFAIFHHKKYFNFHAVYEPYVFMFEQMAPFKLRAISKKPLWINGRKPRSAASPTKGDIENVSEMARDLRSGDEMLYITSMSWSDHRQKYHGYIDDVLFLAFGVEDESSAAIDIFAGDLVQDLGFC